MLKRFRVPGLIHLGLLAASLLAWGLGVFEPFETRLIDHRFRARGPRTPTDRVIVVGITDRCIEELGGWPIRRSAYAEVLDKLKRAGATAIGIDLLFDTLSSTAEDALLATATADSGAVLATILQERKEFVDGRLIAREDLLRPHPLFAPAGQPTGFINTKYEDVNVDGILRALPLRETAGGRPIDSLALALLRSYRAAPGAALRPPVGLNLDRIAPDAFHYVNYYNRASDGVAWIPFGNFFNGEIVGAQYEHFRDKIVLIGPMAPAFQDEHHTPYGPLYGVQVHATVIANALSGEFLARPGLLPLLLIALPLACGMLFLAARATLSVYAGTALGVAALHVAAAYLLFVRAGIVLEILPVGVFAVVAVIVTSFHRLYLSLYWSNVALTKKIEELKALYEISKTIADIENLDTVLRRVLMIAVEVLGATRGSLMLFDEENERLRIEVVFVHGEAPPDEALPVATNPASLESGAGEEAAAAGVAAAEAAAADGAPPAEPLPESVLLAPPPRHTIELAPGEGVAGVVFEERRPAIINRGSRDPRFKSLQARDQDVDNLLCVPMMLKDRCIGVINISNKRDGSNFLDTDAKLMEMVSHHAATVIENARLYKLATVDGMTGLYVHRYFKIRMREEFLRAIRYRKHISVIMTDIDHFKKFNDTYGHQMGDLVLTQVAAVLRETARLSDFPARYGGEEFIIILPETDAEGALKLAERVRERVEERVLNTSKGPLSVTISVGVSNFPDSAARTADELISFADAALYKAKATGRNRTCVYR